MKLYYSKPRELAYTRKVWKEVTPERWDTLPEGRREMLVKKEGGIRLVEFIREENDV